MFSHQNSDTDRLFKAIEFNQPDFITLYLKNGADLKAKKDNITPVKLAISLQRWDIIKIIADYIADNNISVQSFFENDPFDLLHALEEATITKETSCILSLKNACVNSDKIILNSKLATENLFNEIKQGKSDFIQFRLERGADLNAIDDGLTPCELAASLQHWNIIEIIIDFLREKNISVKPTFFEKDPLRLGYILKLAIVGNQFNLSSKLIEAGVNLETTDITDKNIQLIKEKKLTGSLITQIDKELYFHYSCISALYLAVSNNNLDLVLILLKAGACPNQPSAIFIHVSGKRDEEYPLHLAIRNGFEKIAATLMLYNADFSPAIIKWEPQFNKLINGAPCYQNGNITTYKQTQTIGCTPETLNKNSYKEAWSLANNTLLLTEKIFLLLLGSNQINSLCYTCPIDVWGIILNNMFLIKNDSWIYSFNLIELDKIIKRYQETYRISSINNFVFKYNLFPDYNKTQESKDFVEAMDQNKHDSEKIQLLKYNFFKERFSTNTYNPESRAVRYMKAEGITNDAQIEAYRQEYLKNARNDENKVEEVNEEFEGFVLLKK